MTMVEPYKTSVALTVFCLLSPIILVNFLPQGITSTFRLGDGYIEVQDIDLSKGVAKLLLVFDEETGSADFRDRSTSWLVINQTDQFGGDIIAYPIGRADPNWRLIGTNNITIWHWKLEKTFQLEYETNGDRFLLFPFEVFAVSFYIATNESRSFDAGIDIPNFSVSIDQQRVDYNQSSWNFQAEGCPDLLKMDLLVFHSQEYKAIAILLFIVLLIVIVVGILLFKKRNDIQDSDFFRISSSLMIFVPVFFFTFRNSIAPFYLTIFDTICFVAGIMHGSLLAGKLATISRTQKTEATHEEENAVEQNARSVRNVQLESSIVEFWLRIFSFLKSITPYHIVKRFVPSIETTDNTDRYVSGCMLLSIASLVVCSAPNLQWWELIILGWGAWRVLAIITTQINLLLFDEYREMKAGRPYRIRGFRRLIILLLQNYAEVIFWFAVLYRNMNWALATSGVNVDSFLVSLNFSFVTMTSFGQSSVFPQEGTPAWILMLVQSTIGIIMALLVLSRFVSLIPKPKSGLKEEGQEVHAQTKKKS